MTDFGNIALMNKDDAFNDKMSLPGVKLGDMSSRSVRPTVRVTSICFSPTGNNFLMPIIRPISFTILIFLPTTGMQWIATSTEGLFLYNHDTWRIFVPFSADEDIAPETIKKALNEKVYDKGYLFNIELSCFELNNVNPCSFMKFTALMYALRLNLKDKIREVFENIPVSSSKSSNLVLFSSEANCYLLQFSVEAVCKALTPDYWVLFMQFLAAEIGESRHFQFCLKWAKSFLGSHLMELKQDPRIRPALNLLEKNMVDKQKDLISL